MTIQISVTVWTVICFTLLYLVLKFLLFDPVHKIMDQRQEIIAEKEAKYNEAKKLKEQKRENEIKEREAALEKSQEIAKEKISQIRSDGKIMLEKAKRERIDTVVEYEKSQHEKYLDDITNAGKDIDGIASAFLRNLFAE